MSEYVLKEYRRRAPRSDYCLSYEGAFPWHPHRFCGKEDGGTNHAERFFGTLRSGLSRLAHKIYSFSKSIERYLDAIHLFIATHNLGIMQSDAVIHQSVFLMQRGNE